MNLYIEIRDLFGSNENRDMLHSKRMDKLNELINKNQKETFKHGKEVGTLECLKELEQKLQKLKRED